MKRILVAAVSAAMVLFNSAAVFGAEQPEKSITWRFEDGVLTFSGTGQMSRETVENYSGLWQIEDEPVKIVVEPGITEIDGVIGSEACEELILPEGLEIMRVGGWSDFILPRPKSRLKKVKLPESLRQLKLGSFRGSSIEEIHVPKNLVDADRGFYMMECLKDITVSEENPVYSSVDGILYSKDGKTLIQYPVGREKTENHIPEGTEKIAMGAFERYNNIEIDRFNTLVIPEGVTSVGASAFYDCYVQTVYLPKSLTEIGTNAFFNYNHAIVPNPKYHLGRPEIKSVYYAGSKADWEKIVVINKKAETVGTFVLNDNVRSVFMTRPPIHYGEISVKFHDRYLNFDTYPVLRNGHTLVPLKAMSMIKDISVGWCINADGEMDVTRPVELCQAGLNASGQEVCVLKIEIPVVEKYMYVDGERVELECAAEVVNGNVMVPVRPIAEAMGYKVEWDDETRSVLITR